MTDVPRSGIESLLRAVNALSDAERDSALGWLLGTLGAGVAGQGLASLPPLSGIEQDVVTEVQAPGLRGPAQVVPIRLDSAAHARLREWCREHGFTMATVIRGLVDQFLAGQAGQPRGPAKPGSPLR